MASEYLSLLDCRQSALRRIRHFLDGLCKPASSATPAVAPLLDKATLRASAHVLSTASHQSLPVWWKTTSGTTGRPIPIPYSADFYLDTKYAVFHKIWRLAKGKELGGQFYLAVTLTDLEGEAGGICVDPLYSNGIVARLSIDVRHPERVRDATKILGRLNPTILSTKPSVLAALCEFGGFRLASPGLLIVGGAALTTELRKKARLVFGTEAVSVYATSELGVIAAECSQERLHIFEHEVAARDDHPDAQGEIVVSNFGNGALPLRNYRTGDRGRIADSPCTCGVKWRWIERLEGRTVPLFRFAGGAVMSPTRLNRFMSEFAGVQEFQVDLCAGKELIVRVEHDGESLSAMRAFFMSKVPSDVNVRLIEARFVSSEKFARYRVIE